jgi:hypothetical protein
MMGTDKTPAQMPRDLDLACLTPLRALPPGQPVRTMEMAFA